MKDLNMDIDWRTVQMFLGEDGVSEVEVDSDNHHKMRCTCPVFSNYARCKHTRFVRKAMMENDGHYSVQIPTDVEDEVAIEAISGTADDFRNFIIHYGRVEVL